MILRILETESKTFKIVYQSYDEFWRYVYIQDEEGYFDVAEYTDINECMRNFKCIERLGLRLTKDNKAVLFDDKTELIMEVKQ